MSTYAKASQVLSLGILRVTDALTMALGFVVTYRVRDFLDRPDGIRSLVNLLPDRAVPLLVAPLADYWWIILLAAAYWPFVLDQFNFYQHPVSYPWRKSAWTLVKAALAILAGVIFALFLLHVKWANRTYLVGAVAGSALLTFARHSIYVYVVRQRRRAGSLKGYPVLLATRPDEAEAMARWVQSHPEENYSLEGILLLDSLGTRAAPADIDGIPVCGGEAQLVRCLHEKSISSVIIASGGLSLDMVRRIVTVCEVEGVDAWLLADFVKTRTARTTTGVIGGRDALLFTTNTASSWQRAAKRIMDIVGSVIGIVLLSPVMLVVAALIRLTSPGPVLFRQKRCGLHGKPFTMLKFRTMKSDAEARKAELESLNEMSGPVFKIANDPRITPIGRTLRRWSLDEFPQLFNVLAGQMSLVGPRPLPVYEVEKFNDDSHRRRLSMKPGLTCLWQIRGRNQVSNFEEWVRLDLEYIDRWSLMLDFEILLKTPVVVLEGTGV